MTITEEHIKASLISAVEDKLRRRIQERVNQHQAEMETLNRTKHELLEGRAKINDIITKLEKEEVGHSTDHFEPLSVDHVFLMIDFFDFQNDLKSNIAILQEKEETLKKSLDTLEKVDEIDVDEAVTTTAPLYRQYV